jgi:hypothetical protein
MITSAKIHGPVRRHPDKDTVWRTHILHGGLRAHLKRSQRVGDRFCPSGCLILFAMSLDRFDHLNPGNVLPELVRASNKSPNFLP